MDFGLEQWSCAVSFIDVPKNDGMGYIFFAAFQLFGSSLNPVEFVVVVHSFSNALFPSLLFCLLWSVFPFFSHPVQ